MNQTIQFAACASILLAALAGCGPSSDGGGNTEMDRMAAALDKPKPAAKETQPAEPAPIAQPAPQPSPERTPPPETVAAQPAAEPAPVAQAAAAQYTAPEEIRATDPRRGRVFHNQPGYLNAVFSARFTAENSLTFDKVKHATDLYEATNGYKPKSHEEFMREIIDANYIELPELRDGYEYWYNAEEGELMMRKPIAEGEQAPVTNDQ
jgi:hypothetical protein